MGLEKLLGNIEIKIKNIKYNKNTRKLQKKNVFQIN